MTILNYLAKLQAVGLPVVSADDSGAASFSRDLTDAERLLLTDIIDPAGKPARTRLAQSRITAKAIPNWATFSQSQANTWYQTNVRDPFTAATTLAAMKLVVGTLINVVWAIIQMELSIRDHVWPDLPDG
jgi:hypothetical protein